MKNGAVFLDFEYRDSTEAGITLILGCFWHLPSNERVAIDFREPDAADHLRALQVRWDDATWYCFSARAEMTSFLVAGLTIDDMDWVDLMVEARQITGTHHHYEARRAGLLVTLEALGIPSSGDVQWKEAMRRVILDNETYTDEQWQEIVRYCWSDIEPLPALWHAILTIHSQRKFASQPIAPFQAAQSVFRAESLKALSKLEHRSRGFPIDVAWLERIYANHRAIRKLIAQRTNERYGKPLFRYVKNKDAYSFHMKALEELIDTLPYPVRWERTPTGKRRRDAEYLETFCREHQEFRELHTTFLLLDQLKSADLRKFLKNGFIKGSSIPFYTVTSRSQPIVREGFIFNLPHWLRTLVRPQPNHVVVAGDWSQQEIVVGAALSGDKMLAKALATGDVYSALGIMAGVIPAGGTKKTHPIERASFKSIQLGIGYGMGVTRLGQRLFIDLQNAGVAISLEDATERAAQILGWHKRTFTAYWSFISREVSIAKEQGWTRAGDGWTYFANLNSSYTKLQNFPMQANSAVMLREALKELAAIPEIELICTLHDSIVIYCHEDDADIHKNHLIRSMDHASQRVLWKAPLRLPIGTEVHTYTHATGYFDDEGKEMYDNVVHLLEDLGV